MPLDLFFISKHLPLGADKHSGITQTKKKLLMWDVNIHLPQAQLLTPVNAVNTKIKDLQNINREIVIRIQKETWVH